MAVIQMSDRELTLLRTLIGRPGSKCPGSFSARPKGSNGRLSPTSKGSQPKGQDGPLRSGLIRRQGPRRFWNRTRQDRRDNPDRSSLFSYIGLTIVVRSPRAIPETDTLEPARMPVPGGVWHCVQAHVMPRMVAQTPIVTSLTDPSLG
jgi:hypothetical protein